VIDDAVRQYLDRPIGLQGLPGEPIGGSLDPHVGVA
jgi:hypothetical protein